jgi:hypothetical protein
LYYGYAMKGPQGQIRPADAIQRAIKVARIATGEITENLPDPRHSNGGKARAKKLSGKRRTAIAKKAAKERWKD